MFFVFVLVNVSVFVCLFVHQCVVVQLSVNHGNLNVSLWGLQTMKAHSFLNFIFLVVREKDEFVLSLESATSIQKPRNLLNVAYHPQPAVCYIITWIVFAKEAFFEFTSVLNLIFSFSQILQLFSGDKNNKMQFLVLKYSSWNTGCFKLALYLVKWYHYIICNKEFFQ